MGILIALCILIFGSVCALIINIIWIKFRKNIATLAKIYLALFLLFCIPFAYLFWQYSQLNTMIIPFTRLSANSVSFNFTPIKSGNYSVDLAFFDPAINKKYFACGFSWGKSTEKECHNALIFRRVSGTINTLPFSVHAHYQQVLGDDDLNYGFENHSLKEPALHLIQFFGKANIPVKGRITVAANNAELVSAKAAIVVGPSDDDYMVVFSSFISFIIFSIPFLLTTLFIYLIRIIKRVA